MKKTINYLSGLVAGVLLLNVGFASCEFNTSNPNVSNADSKTEFEIPEKPDSGQSENPNQSQKSPTENKRFNVGDIVYSDGSSSSAEEYDKSKKAVAVVFFDENGNALGLGISKITQQKWAPKETTGYSINFEEIQSNYDVNTATISGDLDGSDNWKKILENDVSGAGTPEENYPAFYFVNTYSETNGLTGTGFETGWYVPSLFELSAIYKNFEKLNNTIKKISFEDNCLSETSKQGYWSSSQNPDDVTKAWFIDFRNGEIKATVKSTKRYVRAIRKL